MIQKHFKAKFAEILLSERPNTEYKVGWHIYSTSRPASFFGKGREPHRHATWFATRLLLFHAALRLITVAAELQGMVWGSRPRDRGVFRVRATRR